MTLTDTRKIINKRAGDYGERVRCRSAAEWQ